VKLKRINGRYKEYRSALAKARNALVQNGELEFLWTVARMAKQYALTGKDAVSFFAHLQAAGIYKPGKDLTRTSYVDKSSAGLNVFTILDVSTGHIRESDSHLLFEDSLPGPGAAIAFQKDDDGYFVHVCHDCAGDYIEKFKENGYSEEFINIYRQALAAGAGWICFDTDGSTSGRLPDFSW